MEKPIPTLSQLVRECELACSNVEPIYTSLINGQFTQASEFLKDYLSKWFDISGIEITANDMVEYQKQIQE